MTQTEAAFFLAVAVGLASVASSLFTGMSLRFLARQAEAAAEQSRLLIQQTELARQNSDHLYAATELDFNLEVMMKLDEALGRVAADPELHSEIWTNKAEGTRAQIAGDSILDVVAMALKACQRLPAFQANKNDWSDFGKYLMENSDRLRMRVLENPQWWERIAPDARAAEEQRAPREDDANGA